MPKKKGAASKQQSLEAGRKKLEEFRARKQRGESKQKRAKASGATDQEEGGPTAEGSSADAASSPAPILTGPTQPAESPQALLADALSTSPVPHPNPVIAKVIADVAHSEAGRDECSHDPDGADGNTPSPLEGQPMQGVQPAEARDGVSPLPAECQGDHPAVGPEDKPFHTALHYSAQATSENAALQPHVLSDPPVSAEPYMSATSAVSLTRPEVPAATEAAVHATVVQEQPESEAGRIGGTPDGCGSPGASRESTTSAALSSVNDSRERVSELQASLAAATENTRGTEERLGALRLDLAEALGENSSLKSKLEELERSLQQLSDLNTDLNVEAARLREGHDVAVEEASALRARALAAEKAEMGLQGQVQESRREAHMANEKMAAEKQRCLAAEAKAAAAEERAAQAMKETQAALQQVGAAEAKAREAEETATAQTNNAAGAKSQLLRERDSMAAQLRVAVGRREEAEEDLSRAEQEIQSLREEVHRLTYEDKQNGAFREGTSSANGDRSEEDWQQMQMKVVELEVQLRESQGETTIAYAQVEKLKGALATADEDSEEKIRAYEEAHARAEALQARVGEIEAGEEELRAQQAKTSENCQTLQKELDDRGQLVEALRTQLELKSRELLLAKQHNTRRGRGVPSNGKEEDMVRASMELQTALNHTKAALEDSRKQVEVVRAENEPLQRKIDQLKEARNRLLQEVDLQGYEIERLYEENVSISKRLDDASRISKEWESQLHSALAQNQQMREMVDARGSLDPSQMRETLAQLDSEGAADVAATGDTPSTLARSGGDLADYRALALEERSQRLALEEKVATLNAEYTRILQQVGDLAKDYSPVLSHIEARLSLVMRDPMSVVDAAGKSTV